jgi:ABC-type nitrate/sulfonate/bicarbonate transport system permease component
MVAASSGLGWMVINASSYLRTDIVMLGILLLGGIGYLLDLLLLGLQRLFVPWAGKNNECHHAGKCLALFCGQAAAVHGA